MRLLEEEEEGRNEVNSRWRRLASWQEGLKLVKLSPCPWANPTHSKQGGQAGKLRASDESMPLSDIYCIYLVLRLHMNMVREAFPIVSGARRSVRLM